MYDNPELYTFEEVFNATCEYYKNAGFPDDPSLLAHTFASKYALRVSGDATKKVFVEKTPDQMHDRLAKEFHRIECKYSNPRSLEEIRASFDKFSKIVPQGGPMYGIGNPYSVVSLSNCVVWDSPEDNLSNIYDVGRDLSNLFKRRCGVGIDISTLRPEGAAVNNSAMISSGAWSFTKLYSFICGHTSQCLAGDTLVLTNNGLVPIKTVFPEDLVWTKVGWVKVRKVLKNEKPLVRITTKSGREISASKDHVFHTASGEKPIQDFKVGDTLSQILGQGWESKEKLVLFFNSDEGSDECDHIRLDKHLAYLLGHIINSSTVNYIDSTIHLYFDNKIICKESLLNISNALSQLSCKVKAYVTDSIDTGINVILHSKEFLSLLINNHLYKASENDEVIFPDIIMSASDSVLKNFLSGYIENTIPYSINNEVIRIHMPSENFARKFQLSLQALGVDSIISKDAHGRYCLDTAHDIHIALEHEKEYVYKNPRGFRINEDLGNLLKSQNKTVKAALIKESAYPTLFSDVIASIEPFACGVPQPVYDLVLETEHLFFANGFYVHNSGRRGALMLTLNCSHPDIEKFITCKVDRNQVTNANISVILTDDFMERVVRDEDWDLTFNGKVYKTVKAKELWRLICNTAHDTAEPGLIFIDNYKRNMPLNYYDNFEIISVNPCSEIALPPRDSCRLMSINLTGFVKNPHTKEAYFDEEDYKKHVSLAMRLMDDLIDLEIECLDNIITHTDTSTEEKAFQDMKERAIQGRRTGLGTHGLADCLASLRIKYDSLEAQEIVDMIYRNLRDGAYKESAIMASERGTFPIFDYDTHYKSEFTSRLPKDILELIKKNGIRNGAMLTNAPTGTVSLVSMNCSSGIEPVFSNEYFRSKKIQDTDSLTHVDRIDDLGIKWQEYKVYHPNVLNYYKINNIPVGEELPDYFVTSDKINWIERVKIQSIITQYLDHGVSSTINLPKDVGVETVERIYEESWKLGLKGVTVYVDGCRDAVLKTETQVSGKHWYNRPNDLPCEIHKVNVKVNGQQDNWVVIVGLKDAKPFEIFGGPLNGLEGVELPSTGFIRKVRRKNTKARYELRDNDSQIIRSLGDEFHASEYSVLNRLLSLSLRNNAGVSYAVDQLLRDKDTDFIAYSRVIARVLKKYIVDGTHSSVSCPECMSKALVFEEGCFVCRDCGFSGCN